MKTVKLASARYLDDLPTAGNDGGQAFRDLELEERMLRAAQKTGMQRTNFQALMKKHGIKLMKPKEPS